MKKTLLFFALALCANLLSAQCDDLFFSEYVEGYSNNKALEIYNPTGSAINLSGYSLVRFSNGSTTANDQKVIQLPDAILPSNGTYVIVVDLTDVADFDTQFDKPAWNGYNVIDTIFDSVTNLPVLDDDGNVLLGPQYNDSGSALFGTDYNEQYDLQCKSNVFLCPDYDTNNTMYFNGNDAVALITGAEVAADGSNLVDVIGVIGEDPTDDGNDAWLSADGGWLTKDKTLVRNADVVTGRNALADVVAQAGGTFIGAEWTIYPKNSFQYLRAHNSTCNTTTKPDEISCSTFVGTNDFNAVSFAMFPNPTSGLVKIEAEENINAISVFNFMGQRMYTQEFNNTNTAINIDLSNFATGMYLVDISFEGSKRSIQKLVID
ncbi:MAG: hypothetical protein ACI8YQ_002656 [Polaribacter sp.]|jgi:hypothetical protein